MKDLINMIIFILILGIILTTALVAMNYYTEPLIIKNEGVRLKVSILNALDIQFTQDQLENLFSEKVSIKENAGNTYYISTDGIIAFEFSGSGLWGPISGVLAMRPDLKTIDGISIIHQEETPGLGSRIAEIIYLDTFKDKVFSPNLVPTASREGLPENQIDGITGATMSCDAFLDILNEQFEKYISTIPGEL